MTETVLIIFLIWGTGESGRAATSVRFHSKEACLEAIKAFDSPRDFLHNNQDTPVFKAVCIADPLKKD